MQITKKKGGIRVVGHKSGKSGGGGRQPVEAPDSLHSIAYARVLDLVSEGPIVGPVHGIEEIAKDIYLNETPVMNEDGTLNFSGVTIDYRSGTQDQDYIQGFPASEVTIGVGVEITSSQPWTQFISDTSLSAVRVMVGFNGLSRRDASNGDLNGYRIEYVVELATDGGFFETVVNTAADGKTTQLYERSHRINLPEASTGWTIRVRRITINSDDSLISDTMLMQSYTNIVDAKLRHPMSALVGIQIDASQFQSVPTRAYRIRGRIISVPTNYNPETRQYSGTWDGTFKQAWTNNPAWIFYDLVSNDRYGAGERVTPESLSMLKWSLYPIAQYCDELVPDGLGGQEPRFCCNVYIQEAGDAARVLADLSAVFMGMVYESSGAILASADMPASWTYTYSNSNARDGVFRYSGTAKRTRYTVAQVSYNDMSDFGRAKMEVYEDREGVNRYGIKLTQITAFGCTSRGQALRAGKWAIITSKAQTDAVTFQVGLDHAVVNPGSVVRIADSNRAGRRIGGRIRAVNSATEIVLDRGVDVIGGDTLVINLPSGISESREISEVSAPSMRADYALTEWTADTTELSADITGFLNAVTTITVKTPFSELPEVENVWTVESEERTNRLFRVMSIGLRDGIYAEIKAVEHNPSKYDSIDFGTKLENPPITVIPPNVMPIPENVIAESYSVLVQGVAVHNARFSWDKVDEATEYQVQWRRDLSDWIEGGRTGSTSLEIENIRTGAYVVRVRSLNALGIPSGWGYSVSTQLIGNLEPPPALSSLTATGIVFGIELKWTIPQAISPIEKTEIWYSQTNNRADAILLGQFAYPQNKHTMMGLAAGARFYFWGRVQDKLGEYGDWYPLSSSGGVMGVSSTDAGEILDYLTGQITESQLGQQLLAKIESGAASAVEIEQIVNELAAMYTIKTQLTVDGIPYMAGIGVGVENNEGIITSQILLAAARVAILDESSGVTVSPFVVQGGQVFINQAVIGEAWIKTANIENAAITTAKIQDAAINNAKIQDAAITTAKIGDAQISTAKIGTAQIDTLRIAGGAVTAATGTDFYLDFGVGSGNNSVSVTANLPDNAFGIAMYTFKVMDWGAGTGGAGSNYVAQIDGFTYSSGNINSPDDAVNAPPRNGSGTRAMAAGSRTATLTFDRPTTGTIEIQGTLSLLSWMR